MKLTYLFALSIILLNFLCLAESATENLSSPDKRINVGIIFTKASSNTNLQDKFKICISSLLKYATIDLNLYIIGDKESQLLAKKFISKLDFVQVNYELIELDSDDLAKKLHKVVSEMQVHFSHSPSSYYGDSLFFLSIGLFQVFDPNIKRMILLDADLKFKQDIRELYKLFENFTETNVIGIARDAQPVYRHLFWKYRQENPNTRVGNPPPNGLTGFNSGVLLLDIEKMRDSKLYKELIVAKNVQRLTEKYSFKGHLGDQDFFTLIGMEHEELFYVLPCTWNRQLCRWWSNHGYTEIFEDYFKCDGEPNILHGNCNTPIPKDDDDLVYERIFQEQNKNIEL
jgi:lipopolysaccharide biosynthesis glycosyltransferase